MGATVFSLFGVALSYVSSIPWWIPLLLLFLGAPLSLWRPFESVTVRLLPGTRKAKGRELALFVASLHRVNLRHPFPVRRWVLAIEDSPVLNASTSGRHVLTLTRTALSLPDPLLDAVLAHELAHQAGGDTIAKSVRWWFLLPVRILLKALRYGAWGAVAFSVFGVIQVIVAAVFTALLYLVTIPLLLILPLNAAIERKNELAADRYAAEAGFRTELVALLHGFTTAEQAPRSLWARFTATHPSIEDRLQAIYDNYQDVDDEYFDGA